MRVPGIKEKVFGLSFWSFDPVPAPLLFVCFVPLCHKQGTGIIFRNRIFAGIIGHFDRIYDDFLTLTMTDVRDVELMMTTTTTTMMLMMMMMMVMMMMMTMLMRRTAKTTTDDKMTF